MQRSISPPIGDLDNLRQPLTRGERVVFEFFHAHLAPEWEIYLQPHLNGLRPDFVLLHPKIGIAVFEVKDWNLDAMDYWIRESNSGQPTLIGRKKGKEFLRQSQNPVEKILLYKNELFDLYCPRLDSISGFAVITAGVIFPFADDDRVKALLQPSLDYRNLSKYPRYAPVSGCNAIQSGDLNSVFPESSRKSSRYMDETKAKDLRNWLIEPDASVVQRRPLELDQRQLALARSRTDSGYRRIKGAAGSGKSLILAARAAELLGQGKQVLVVTYNITLLHYLMDVAVRWPSSSGKTRRDVTWLNFHHWCKRVCFNSGHQESYSALWSESNEKDVLAVTLPRLVGSILDKDGGSVIPKYDAVLVDEAQDFYPSWWNVLRKVCRKEGEMLLVADATQDVYQTAGMWTDEAMIGAGFRGGWSELKVSYRMPSQAAQLAREFAKRFLPNNTVDLPHTLQGELELYSCALRWVQTTESMAAKICAQEILNTPKNVEPETVAIADITFLSGSRSFGRQVVGILGEKGVKAVHTFDENEKKSRRQKMGFYMGDARLKATTFHSFKGWEARVLILYVGSTTDRKSLAAIYTGITRIKRHSSGSFLTVISAAPTLSEFGKTWPNYEEVA